LDYREFAGGRHDILNDSMHREVTATIVGFINERIAKT
jgi:alpha-beta hydrolase superfamily lysophospholipase